MSNPIGSGTSENAMREAGHAPLTIKELLKRIIGNTAWGDFLYDYRFVSYFAPDGSMEGTNNVGSYNTGQWHANPDANTLTVSWNQSWIPATLRAYDINGTLHFFDQTTGQWHSSFDKIVPGKQALEV